MLFKPLSALHAVHRAFVSRAIRQRQNHLNSGRNHQKHAYLRIANTDTKPVGAPDPKRPLPYRFPVVSPFRSLFPRIAFNHASRLPVLVVLSARHRSLLRNAIANAQLTVSERALAHRIVANSAPAAAYAFSHLPQSNLAQRRYYASAAPDSHSSMILTQSTRDQVWRTIFHPHAPSAPSQRNFPKPVVKQTTTTSPVEVYAQYRRKQVFKTSLATPKQPVSSQNSQRKADSATAVHLDKTTSLLSDIVVPDTRSVGTAAAPSSFVFDEADDASVVSLESFPDVEGSGDMVLSRKDADANKQIRDLDAVIAGDATSLDSAPKKSATASSSSSKQKESEMLDEVREFLKFVNNLIDENRGLGTGRL